jgi:Protein of unknown function (DUF3313)
LEAQVKRSILVAATLATLFLTGGVAAAPPQNWDGLVQVPSKRLKLVYLQPGADFRTYSSVMLDPTEVAFHKDWRRNYHFSVRDPSGRVSEQDVERAVREGVTQASDIFAKAWQKGGYTMASAPGPDVLRIKTAILNINVSAPDVRASPSRTAADTAGDAVLVVEVRDSMSNALLGRAVDHRIAGDHTIGWRSSVTNRGDFRDLVENWAKISVQGLAELKNTSPAAR